MTARELYERNLAIPSDIGGHMGTLLNLANDCLHITEFGVRGGNSTSCWLASEPITLRCFDRDIPAELELFTKIAAVQNIDFAFIQADTATIEDIAQTDLLFLDTTHNAQQLRSELRHHARVAKFIVLHDTETNAWTGEDGGDGLLKVLIEFLLANPQWRIREHHKHCNGLTVLEIDRSHPLA